MIGGPERVPCRPRSPTRSSRRVEFLALPPAPLAPSRRGSSARRPRSSPAGERTPVRRRGARHGGVVIDDLPGRLPLVARHERPLLAGARHGNDRRPLLERRAADVEEPRERLDGAVGRGRGLHRHPEERARLRLGGAPGDDVGLAFGPGRGGRGFGVLLDRSPVPQPGPRIDPGDLFRRDGRVPTDPPEHVPAPVPQRRLSEQQVPPSVPRVPDVPLDHDSGRRPHRRDDRLLRLLVGVVPRPPPVLIVPRLRWTASSDSVPGTYPGGIATTARAATRTEDPSVESRTSGRRSSRRSGIDTTCTGGGARRRAGCAPRR